MKKYLLLITSFLLGSSAFAAVNLSNVECRFSDQSGMKLTIDLVRKNNFAGQTMLSQGWGEEAHPIRKMSLLTTFPRYKAQVKGRKDRQVLTSQTIPVHLVRIFRQEPYAAINSVIEAYIPGEAVLRANNPRIAKAFVITTANMVFTNGTSANLKGICWK